MFDCMVVPILLYDAEIYGYEKSEIIESLFLQFYKIILSDFINLTQLHNFTVSAQDIFTFRRLSVFTVSFKGILQGFMQIMKRFAPSY